MSEPVQPPSTSMDYHATSFSQGRMDFTWEELGSEERAQLERDWEAGKGIIGGHPRYRPGSDRLPDWALEHRFVRSFSLDDERSDSGRLFRSALATSAPMEVEIGFGRGDFLLDRAARLPDRIFLGYEVKTKAARLALDRSERLELGNLWISDDDARVGLKEMIPAGRLAAVHVLFPDPWWKEQHKIKRLFSPPFVDLLATALQPGGFLHFRSDVEAYGELVRYLLSLHPGFSSHQPRLVEEMGPIVPTHREFWCRRHGYPVWTFAFVHRDDT